MNLAQALPTISMAVLLAQWLHRVTKTADNNGKTAGDFAVFRSPHRRRPRISAAEAMPSADNLRQKQQKQREPPPGGYAALLRTLPAGFPQCRG
jgi:hypothetical protein